MSAPPDDTRWTSERTLRIAWTRADAHHPLRARTWRERLVERAPAVIEDVVAGARTLTIIVDPLRADPDAIETLARETVASPLEHDDAPRRTIEIPVCYDDDFAPDLARVAQRAGLSIDDAIGAHASSACRVALFGFAPGFAYLDGLDARVHTPRLDTPRPRVEAGSVGIAGPRTGVYPAPSPGGWNIIGRTPLALFDPSRDPPALLDLADDVRFLRIDRTRFDELLRAERDA
jgi:KipI family sensor histidine kinase inhibitor